MKKKEITFWVEPLFAIYSARPLINRYIKKNYKVWIILRKIDLQIARKYLPKEVVLISIESIDSYWLKIFSNLIRVVITPNIFSTMFERINRKKGVVYFLIGKYVAILFDRKKINKRFRNIFCIFQNRIPTNKLISFSRVSRPYLLASKKIKHINIMESWDHPIKSPYYLYPNFVLTWNKSLALDIKKYQNLKKINKIYPLKLRYIQENVNLKKNEICKKLSKKYLKELERIGNDRFILYPTTTSSLNPDMHKGELILINHLIKLSNNLGLKIYIKPKPNGPIGDYDQYQGLKNVIVGIYSTSTNSIDMLKDEYHSFRYLLLNKTEFLINAGTTFGLEAALAKTEILQLKLSKDLFGSFGEINHNPHIQRYLQVKNFFFYNGNFIDLINFIKKKKYIGYSKRLRYWLLN